MFKKFTFRKFCFFFLKKCLYKQIYVRGCGYAMLIKPMLNFSPIVFELCDIFTCIKKLFKILTSPLLSSNSWSLSRFSHLHPWPGFVVFDHSRSPTLCPVPLFILFLLSLPTMQSGTLTVHGHISLQFMALCDLISSTALSYGSFLENTILRLENQVMVKGDEYVFHLFLIFILQETNTVCACIV